MTHALDMRTLLEAGKAVNRLLPGGGRIHIERPQPFICVYRKATTAADAGTQDLVTTQASYMVFPTSPAGHDAAAGLLVDAVEALAGLFGAVLVLELFSIPVPPHHDPREGPPRPAFELLAARRRAPVKTIEAMEKALLEQSWPGGEPAIRAVHKHHRAPENLAPLLPARLRKREDVIDLGLGVRAIYREPESEAVLPVIWREVRRALTTALRQSVYAFSHARARYRPAHFHELGVQAIEDMVWDVDRALADVGDSFDLVLDSTPVNSEAAWSQFRSSKYQRTPEFHYRPLRHDPGALKRRLYEVPLEEVGDPALHALFAEKREELDRQIGLLGDRGSRCFLYGSQQVYGVPDEPLLALAGKIVAAIPPRAREPDRGEPLDAESFARMAERELAHYRNTCPDLKAKVEIRDDVPGLIVSSGTLLIGTRAVVSAGRAPATIAHEVGTHVLTYYNGLAQPFQQLHAGMAGYEALQEGIAVLAEFLVGGLSRPRLRLLAGRVLAVATLVDGADFVETVRVLHTDYGFSHRGAYSIAMRVHRSGGLTKDMVYLKGLDDLLNHLKGSDAPFENLLVGKIALNHLDLVEELRWRNILKAPTILPRYLSDPCARRRLDKARQGLSPLDFIDKERT